MPKIVKPLTDVQVKNAKPKKNHYTLSDGKGLFLKITEQGTKLWRFKFTQPGNGKPNSLSFGTYPEVSLLEAREKREEARKLLAKGIDPAQAKHNAKLNAAIAAANTFESLAREWLVFKVGSWGASSESYARKRLEKDVFPKIGNIPITDIRAPILLEVIRKVENRGALDMARRVGQYCGQIFRYAIATGRAEIDPYTPLRGALKTPPKNHHAAITVSEFPEFMKAFKKIEGRMFPRNRILFRLMMLTFVRTSELTGTEWSEIDFENETWIIPWHRMKMGKKTLNPRKVDHHTFLPRQGWELLRELHEYTGGNRFLFPHIRDHEKHVTDFVITAAIRRMGYTGKMTGHGFRSLAMGIIKEKLGYRHEVIDRQLSHMSSDTYGEAYDRAMFLDERKEMMQRFADYIDSVENAQVKVARSSSKAK